MTILCRSTIISSNSMASNGTNKQYTKLVAVYSLSLLLHKQHHINFDKYIVLILKIIIMFNKFSNSLYLASPLHIHTYKCGLVPYYLKAIWNADEMHILVFVLYKEFIKRFLTEIKKM